MASNIKTIAADIRIREEDRGSYLTVDEKYNLAWSKSKITSSGGVWEYNVISTDSYVVLPDAELNAGFCVAIMRGKTTNNENAKIAIIPHKKSSGKYDTIMGSHIVYFSDGLKLKHKYDGKVSIEEFADEDDYSSIILKSVLNNEGGADGERYTWIIINGVGVWNAENIFSDSDIENPKEDSLYNEIKKLYSHADVSMQTAGLNSLSAGVNTVDLEFVPITKTDLSIGGTKALKSIDEESSLVKNIPTYIIGRFTDDLPNRYKLYSEHQISNINVFGPTNYNWNIPNNLKNNVRINDINNNVINLGYVYNDSFGWWADNKDKSFSKALGLRQKGSINSNYINSIGIIKAVVNVNLSEIGLEKKASQIKKIYCMIQNFFEVSDNYTMPYTNIFKVPQNVENPSDISLNEVITLTSAGLGETNSDSGYGSLIQIPITDTDISNGSFNIILEYAYKNVGTNNTVLGTPEQFLRLNNKSNQYCILNFVGVEQIKATSISPDVYFETISIAGIAQNTSTADSTTGKPYENANLSSETNYGADAIISGSYDEMNYQEGITRSFFSKNGLYKPSEKNVTKTVIEYDNGFDTIGKTTASKIALKGRLSIDWANRKLQYNGLIITNGKVYACSLGETKFEESSNSLVFTNYLGETITLNDALKVEHVGLSKIPYIYKNTKPATVEMNITHYKTVIGNLTNIETLMHYKCGWEAAETKWDENKLEDYEWDGLKNLNDFPVSKQCIRLIGERTSLLPYTQNVPNKSPVKYFSTKPNQLTYKSSDNENDFQPLIANDFVDLHFNPTISGTLICNLDLPIDSGLSSTGYIILKYNDTNSFDFVKDSGANINANQTPGFNTLKINFTDDVKEYKEYRYKVIIYDALWVNTTILDKGIQETHAPCNSAITRYRPLNMNDYNINGRLAGINDFKTLFSSSYYGPYTIVSNNTTNSSKASFDAIFGITDKTTINDSTSDFKERFNNLFEADGNGAIINSNINNKILGSTFLFHAYVLRKGV